MKRDMELVREIIIELSEGKYKSSIKWDSEEDKLYYYHLKIMRKENLISFKETPTKDKVLLSAAQLEWKGNEFLQTFSNNSVWEKTKDFIKRKGIEEADIYIDMLIELGKTQIKQSLGME
ncbi:DUF2513 domain-containing protein [Neobacillus sedimentimangrovi]|uniref:DUF2513 domain-containing protein n=1 Tax=Neobacillus sedimentimangrovi TaxID=2699460 RepID=UPI0013D3E484|nr:DUF2513 domain-containing protein [Neobacillus sedimentimangrovi]